MTWLAQCSTGWVQVSPEAEQLPRSQETREMTSMAIASRRWYSLAPLARLGSSQLTAL